MRLRTSIRAITTWGAALLMLGAGVPGLEAQNATITAIPALGLGNVTTAIAIGANGTAVTGLSSGNGTVAVPYLWTPGGGTVSFSNTGNAATIVPANVNDYQGQPVVVGTCLNSGKLEPFVYNATAANFTALTPNGSDQGARGMGISNAGYVAVNGFGTNVTVFTGYLYGPNGSGGYTVTTLGGLGGVFGISNDSAGLPYLIPSVKEASVFYPFSVSNSTAVVLPGNYGYSEVDAISPLGRYVVGVASNNATAGQTLKRGFLYDSQSFSARILTPFNPSDVFAACRTVSNDTGANGAIGGGTSGSSSVTDTGTAVLFDTALNATLDLKQLLKSTVYNVDMSGWYALNEVHGISADGKTIVGDGILAGPNATAGLKAAFVVTLSQLPEEFDSVAIVANPVSQTVVVNGNATFFVAAVPGDLSDGSPDPVLRYQWFKKDLDGSNTTEIVNANSNTLTLVGVVKATDQKFYFCQASNSTFISTNGTSGFANSTAAFLTVNGTLPAITCKVGSTTFTSNISVPINKSFTLKATASGGPTYQWMLNGKAISGATNATYVVSKAAKNNAGNYTIQTTSVSLGTLTSRAFTVYVLYPPGITTQPASVTVMAGNSAQLTVVATGYPPPTYAWYIHNRALKSPPSYNRATLNIQTVHIPDQNIYRVRVMNSQGFVYSNYANLTVTPFNGGGSGNTSGNTSSGNITGS